MMMFFPGPVPADALLLMRGAGGHIWPKAV